MEPKVSFKKLLFLYPVKEFFWNRLEHQHLPQLMDIMIDTRYRSKGYEINFLVFDDREVANLSVHSNDRVLKSSIKLSPIIESEEDIPYTNIKLIQRLLGPVDELIVCGFHEIDCVIKVARFFYDMGVNTLVDTELTDKLDELSELACFNVNNYNLADILECKFAAKINKYGEGSYIHLPQGSIYAEYPYFKLKNFEPKHTWQEWLEIIREKERPFNINSSKQEEIKRI